MAKLQARHALQHEFMDCNQLANTGLHGTTSIEDWLNPVSIIITVCLLNDLITCGSAQLSRNLFSVDYAALVSQFCVAFRLSIFITDIIHGLVNPF